MVDVSDISTQSVFGAKLCKGRDGCSVGDTGISSLNELKENMLLLAHKEKRAYKFILEIKSGAIRYFKNSFAGPNFLLIPSQIQQHYRSLSKMVRQCTWFVSDTLGFNSGPVNNPPASVFSSVK